MKEDQEALIISRGSENKHADLLGQAPSQGHQTGSETTSPSATSGIPNLWRNLRLTEPPKAIIMISFELKRCTSLTPGPNFKWST